MKFVLVFLGLGAVLFIKKSREWLRWSQSKASGERTGCGVKL
jgi:hypothetical protein